MVTYRQLILDFSKICGNHPQISSFGFGDITQATMDNNTKQAPKYTRAYVVPGNVNLQQNHIGYNFNVIVMDKLNQDLSNQIDVLSDTKEILKDIWTIFYRSYSEQYGGFSNFEMGDWNPDVIPFLDRFDDGFMAGWTMIINLDVPFDYNRCTQPSNFEFQFEQDEVYKSYKLVYEDFKSFSESHSQLNSFGFGDGTQLTMDNYTKQAPKFPRLFVLPENSRFDTNQVRMSFNVVLCDILKLDLTNQLDILSDTLEIGKDLISKLWLSDYEADWGTSCVPFLEKSDTSLAGWTLTINIKHKFDYNRCTLPELSFIPPGTNWKDIMEKWIDYGVEWNK